MAHRIATIRRYTLPTDGYLMDMGYCAGCLSEDPRIVGDPAAHTCGYGAPPDGLVISVRPFTGDYASDELDLETLPF